MVGKMLKFAAVAAASGALVMGPAGFASAQSGSGSLNGASFGSSGSLGTMDTGSLGIGENAPNMVVKQDGNSTRAEFPDRKFLEVCTAVRANPAQLLRLGTDPIGAVLDGAFGTPINIGGIHVNQQAENGVYAIIGACSFKSDLSVQLITVPSGIGSVSGVAEFGSTAGSAMLDQVGSLTGSS